MILPVEELAEPLLHPCGETKLAKVAGSMEPKLDGLGHGESIAGGHRETRRFALSAFEVGGKGGVF